MTYWQRTVQPQRRKFSWGGGVEGGERDGEKEAQQTPFTWNHKSSTLEHQTSAVGWHCHDNYGACCLFTIQSFHETNEHAEIHAICGGVKYWKRVKVLIARWQCELTPSKMCQNEHHFLPSRSSFSGSLTFLFFLGPITSSWLNARFRQLICKNHQKQWSFSRYRLLLDESRNRTSKTTMCFPGSSWVCSVWSCSPAK